MKIRNHRELLSPAVRESARTHRALALSLLEGALKAADAHDATLRAIASARDDGIEFEGVTVFAFGKAARGMAEAALESVSVKGGILLTLDEGELPPLVVRRAGHPIPCPNATDHGREVLALAESLGPADHALCLISGGGSAMLELPAPGVTLELIAELTAHLMKTAASIEELNSVRQSLSALKGGRLACAMHPARITNIAISDVIDNPLDLIASGPTVLPEQPRDASQILEKHGLLEALPQSARALLSGSARKPLRDPREIRITSYVAADNGLARQGLLATGRDHSIELANAPGHIVGEARDAGRAFYLDCLARCARGTCGGVVSGGETVVRVQGNGSGGRNQEFVLSAAQVFTSGLLLAFGTDGVDGTSPAGGALLDAQVIERARTLQLSAADFLAQNDSFEFFRAVESAIITRATGTNVGDIYLYLAPRDGAPA